MKKETQDRLWAILSKNEREELRKAYATPAQSHYSEGYDNARDCYFGHHNLTSDEEPSELLFVERNKVIRHYANSKDNLEHSKHDYRCLFEQGEMQVIECFFGDKCLPDKEPSVQGEPRFKVGDKVVVKNAPHIFRTVTSIEENGLYVLDHVIYDIKESDLEPYTEPEQLSVQDKPKFRKGTIVKVISNDKCGVISHIIKVDKEDDGFFYTLADAKDWRFAEKNLVLVEPYTEPDPELNDILYEKDGISLENESKIDEMMEEKELNRKALYDALCELESASAKVRKALIQYEAV